MEAGIEHEEREGMKTAPGGEAPRVSGWMYWWVSRYFQRCLRRSFHGVWMLGHSAVPVPPVHVPAIVFMNHPSWWDPMVGFFLANHYFRGRRHFAPIDAAALERYRFLGKLGLFGVEQGTRRGAQDFLRMARAVLSRPGTMLWITAQGEFTDARVRPTELRAGIGHVARDFPHAVLVPLAVEYAFWDERFPEVLLNLGKPVTLSADTTARGAKEALAMALEAAQDQLAEAAKSRDASRFTLMLRGRGGVHPVYDAWRGMLAGLRGRGSAGACEYQEKR